MVRYSPISYYEEPLDPDIEQTVEPGIEVHDTKAFPCPKRFRFVGDIGLRGFWFLWRRAKKLLREQAFDFIWIPVPSFYVALLGRILHGGTGVPYGIDYIDPWVRPLHPGQSRWSRAGLSLTVAKVLEPVAVRRAALVSGVAEHYFSEVIERNFAQREVRSVAMPYGFDPRDHEKVPTDPSLPWKEHAGCKPWFYAGAFLPRSRQFVELLFEVIADLRRSRQWDDDVHLFFIGNGFYHGERLSAIAARCGIADLVTESQERKPFLSVLHMLGKAEVAMLVGSTDRHYTASKTFQCLLSRRPVFALLHKESTAAGFLAEAKADDYLVTFDGKDMDGMRPQLRNRLELLKNSDTWSPDLSRLEPHSAKQSACVLAENLDELTRVL